MAEELRGWHSDPYQVHEQRYFSLDGRPTRLVSDAGKTSYDPPPQRGGLDNPIAAAQPSLDGWRPEPYGDLRRIVREEPTGSGWDNGGETSKDGSSTTDGPLAFGPIQPRTPIAIPVPPGLPTPREIGPAPEAGWYPDPTNQSDRRYWDGTGWTEHSSAATAPSESAENGPAVRSRTRTKTSFGLIEVGLLLAVAALVVVLTVTGHSSDTRLPSASGSAAQRQATTSSSSTTTKASTTTSSPAAAKTTPTTTSPAPKPAANEVFAWASKYEGNMETLDTDEENINVADDQLKNNVGGTTPLNYSPVLSASQQLSSDVATDQKLPAIPDSKAQSYWTTELADFAVAAAYYFQGFTDDAHGDAADGLALIQQGDTQVEHAEILGNDLASRLSIAESR